MVKKRETERKKEPEKEGKREKRERETERKIEPEKERGAKRERERARYVLSKERFLLPSSHCQENTV